jgi:hypothetical protein
MSCDWLRTDSITTEQKHKLCKTPWPLVRERTIPTDQPPLVDEIQRQLLWICKRKEHRFYDNRKHKFYNQRITRILWQQKTQILQPRKKNRFYNHKTKNIFYNQGRKHGFYNLRRKTDSTLTKVVLHISCTGASLLEVTNTGHTLTPSRVPRDREQQAGPARLPRCVVLSEVGGSLSHSLSLCHDGSAKAFLLSHYFSSVVVLFPPTQDLGPTCYRKC